MDEVEIRQFRHDWYAPLLKEVVQTKIRRLRNRRKRRAEGYEFYGELQHTVIALFRISVFRGRATHDDQVQLTFNRLDDAADAWSPFRLDAVQFRNDTRTDPLGLCSFRPAFG